MHRYGLAIHLFYHHAVHLIVFDPNYVSVYLCHLQSRRNQQVVGLSKQIEFSESYVSQYRAVIVRRKVAIELTRSLNKRRKTTE